MIGTGIVLGVRCSGWYSMTAFGVWAARGRVTTLEALVSTPDTTGVTPLTASLIASAIGTWVLFSPGEAAVDFGGLTAVLSYALGLALPLWRSWPSAAASADSSLTAIP
jgi:hypothetical protein